MTLFKKGIQIQTRIKKGKEILGQYRGYKQVYSSSPPPASGPTGTLVRQRLTDATLPGGGYVTVGNWDTNVDYWAEAGFDRLTDEAYCFVHFGGTGTIGSIDNYLTDAASMYDGLNDYNDIIINGKFVVVLFVAGTNGAGYETGTDNSDTVKNISNWFQANFNVANTNGKPGIIASSLGGDPLARFMNDLPLEVPNYYSDHFGCETGITTSTGDFVGMRFAAYHSTECVTPAPNYVTTASRLKALNDNQSAGPRVATLLRATHGAHSSPQFKHPLDVDRWKPGKGWLWWFNSVVYNPEPFVDDGEFISFGSGDSIEYTDTEELKIGYQESADTQDAPMVTFAIYEVNGASKYLIRKGSAGEAFKLGINASTQQYVELGDTSASAFTRKRNNTSISLNTLLDLCSISGQAGSFFRDLYHGNSFDSTTTVETGGIYAGNEDDGNIIIGDDGVILREAAIFFPYHNWSTADYQWLYAALATPKDLRLHPQNMPAIWLRAQGGQIKDMLNRGFTINGTPTITT